jgi:hypothetical protein
VAGKLQWKMQFRRPRRRWESNGFWRHGLKWPCLVWVLNVSFCEDRNEFLGFGKQKFLKRWVVMNCSRRSHIVEMANSEVRVVQPIHYVVIPRINFWN